MSKPIIPPSEHGTSHPAEHGTGRTAEHTGPAAGKHPDADQKKAVEESKQPTVSRPGGFKNDPDDATNPNEAIERHRRKLRR